MNNKQKDCFIRLLSSVTYNMDKDQYVKLFGTENRWELMSKDFFSWYVRLDSENVEKLFNYVEEKR